MEGEKRDEEEWKEEETRKEERREKETIAGRKEGRKKQERGNLSQQ